MRLFELFDNPLDYKLMNTRTNPSRGEKDYEYGFRVGNFWYKVYISLYPMLNLIDDEDVHGKAIKDKLPPEFIERAEMYQTVMSVDFGQFEYGEKKRMFPGIGGTSRGPIPVGVGDERSGREGTGNELQVFATVAAIAQEMYNEQKRYIGAIEYGAKDDDPNRKRLYDTMMRKFGISGTRVEFDAPSGSKDIQNRIVIVLK